MSAATTPPSKEEALDMLQLFMDFSISRERTFQYFFELFKITYLPCLYADVSKELGLELSGISAAFLLALSLSLSS